MSEVKPIDVGALVATPVGEYRVVNIHINEDGDSQVSLRLGVHEKTVAYTDIQEAMEEGVAERVNSGHEAWQWRTN